MVYVLWLAVTAMFVQFVVDMRWVVRENRRIRELGLDEFWT